MMNTQVRTCEKCGAEDAEPYFVKAVREIRKLGHKDTHYDYQPRWFCKKDKPRKVVKAI
jgi:hypothetical protein